MSNASQRPALTVEKFGAALEAAGITIPPDERDVIFETAAWLDAGLATLASDRKKVQGQ
jgi:hypothetical protein